MKYGLDVRYIENQQKGDTDPGIDSGSSSYRLNSSLSKIVFKVFQFIVDPCICFCASVALNMSPRLTRLWFVVDCDTFKPCYKNGMN